MSYEIPARPLGLDPAHVANHADIADLLALLVQSRTINVKVAPYSARGDRSAADSAAIQAAMDALKAAGGGTLYIPAGDYDMPSGLQWSSTGTIRVTGDGPNVTRLHMCPAAAPYTALSVARSNRAIIEDLTFVSDLDPGNVTDAYEAIRLDGTAWASLRRVHLTTGTARRVTTGLAVNSASYTDVDCCDLRAYANSVSAYGTADQPTSNLTIRASQLYLNSGSGSPYASALWCDGAVATVRVIGVVFNGGDRGVLWSDITGTGKHPAFGFFYDAELNNNTVAAMQLDAGNQLWATGCWMSTNRGRDGLIDGVRFGAGYLGQSYFTQCTWQGFSGDSARIEAGNGYGFTNCVFGDMNAGKAAPDAYDMLRIEGKAKNVSVVGCHFNTDYYYMFGSVKPRSAIYLGEGVTAVTLVGNLAADGYGTAALDDLSGKAVSTGNSGF